MAHAADGSLAKVTAVQNTVEARTSSGASWSAAKNGDPLKANDRVRTGPGSRAAILYSDQTLHRMNEKSEIEILPPSGGGTGIVKILSGQSYFTTRTPKDFGRVQTPTVTAAIKGTEFAVSVDDDGTSVVTMIEGTVEASNEFGAVTVTKGEEAVAAPGKAPQKRIIVKPRDAVQWSLYFPPVLGGADAERLKGSPLAGAATELSSGQVDAAKKTIADAQAADPHNPVALALASVVALAADDRDRARSLADQAVGADPKSPSALLARSYVAQADFDIDRAAKLAEQAAAADPQSAEAQARVAELRLAMGDRSGARKAAEAAVSRQPGNARALTVLGFVQLAQFQTKDAAASFDKAVAADGAFPLAHAGRGIAQFRLGHLGTGKEEFQTAATLDPAESLYRSYLGKAYYEDYQSKPASKELAAAKSLDPRDPTPWLYDAILLQSENRPVEALENLNKSMELNDQRAVYRSRLLLDEDTAVRSTDLARIYKDLGFEQLGLVSARRSADEDQANYSSHLFLAGNYQSLPGFASSFLSETLQARIYQPVGVNAVRPDSQTGAVEFNEYTALFDRPRAQGYVSGSYGYTDTNLSSYFPNDPATEALFSIDKSDNWSGAGTATYHNDRFSGEVSVSKVSDDGFRVNNDQDTTVYSGLFEGALSGRDTLQLSAIVANRKNGDLPLREIPVLPFPEHFDTDELNFGLAWHREIHRGTDLAVSAIWNSTDQTGTLLGSSIQAETKLSGPQLEAQLVHRSGNVNWIAGAGGFDGTFEATPSSGTTTKADERFANAYGYAKLRGLGPVDVVAGFAVESVDSPVGLLPPRDSFIGQSDVKFQGTAVSPKVGASATFKSGTTIRAAIFSRLAASIGRLQTLEPTQVSGFNQFFEDVGGTKSTNYGIGFDQQLISKIFFGGSWLHRDLDVPEASCPTPDPFSGCAGIPGTLLVHRNENVELVSAYANGLIGKRVTASFEYVLENRMFDTTQLSPLALFENYVKTERYHPEARVFLPFGLYAVVGATYYAQRIQQFDDLVTPVYTTITPRFWTMNAAIGYRLPDRLGLVTLEGTNLTDREFDVYQQSLQEQVIPARRVVLKADFQF
ncbi:MAG TPA: FecR domain-containing protein [Candidatus Polarisedimenticolaceae bacterium]|nr:FecR domain-containing protein [Candidatus Polarisedimenticolaceae bacterium]